MLKLTSLLTILATASAFMAPTGSKAPISSTSLAMDPKAQLGVLPPLGFWDPLGLIKNGPYGTPEDNFAHYRAVEVKHGRIAMAGFLGLITAENFRFEGLLSPSENLKFSDLSNGMAGLKQVPLLGLVQMAVLVGVHEVVVKQREGKQPGDFGLGYFGTSLEEGSAYRKRTLNVEIQNGRLAMLGLLGAMAGEQINGSMLADVHKMFG